MILRSFLLLLFALAPVSHADFDDSVIWKYYLPEPNHEGEVFSNRRTGLESTFFHSNIYRINSLDWNYISMDYNYAEAGLGLEWSSIGYKEYYRRNKYRARFRYALHERITIAPLVEITTEDFGNFGNYTGISGEISANYMAEKYGGGIGVTDMRLKEPYDRSDHNGLFPFLFGSLIFDKGMALSIGIRRFDEGSIRCIFHQSLTVNENLRLKLGYQNNPSDIYGGLSFAFRRFSVIIAYSSVSGLSDSVIWGVSYGR